MCRFILELATLPTAKYLMVERTETKSPRFRFSLAALLWVTTGIAVLLSFLKVAGAGNAIYAYAWGGAIGLIVWTWTICWLAADMRGKVGFWSVFFNGLVGTAVGGLLCIYGIGTSVYQWRPRESYTFWSPEDCRMQVWIVFGSLAGAALGMFLSWRASRSA